MDEYLRLRYVEALNQLRRHPPLIWTRNSFFMLLCTALLAFVLNQRDQLDGIREVVVCAAGLFLAGEWFWVNWAGRELQRDWRAIVMEFERDLFAANDSPTKFGGPFERASEIAKEGKSSRVSITLALLILSAGFVAFWMILLIFAVLR